MSGHGFVPLLQRARARGEAIRLTVVSGQTLDITVRAIGSDVVSGETSDGNSRGVVIPFSSIAYFHPVSGAGLRPGLPEATPAVTAGAPGFGDFLENSRRLSHRVTVVMATGTLTGLILAIEAGVVSLVVRNHSPHVIAISAIVWFSVSA